MNRYFLILSLALTQVSLLAQDTGTRDEEKKKAAYEQLLAHSKKRYYREKVETLVNNLDGADNAYRSLRRRFKSEYDAREKLRGDYEISYDQLFQALSTINTINNAAKKAQRHAEDDQDLDRTKKVYEILVDLLRKNSCQVNYMQIHENDIDSSSTKTSALFAIEIDNTGWAESFSVTLASPFGESCIASGKLKSHCDFLNIDFDKTALKVGKPEAWFDYGETHEKYEIKGIGEDIFNPIVEVGGSQEWTWMRWLELFPNGISQWDIS